MLEALARRPAEGRGGESLLILILSEIEVVAGNTCRDPECGILTLIVTWFF